MTYATISTYNTFTTIIIYNHYIDNKNTHRIEAVGHILVVVWFGLVTGLPFIGVCYLVCFPDRIAHFQLVTSPHTAVLELGTPGVGST